MYYIQLPNIAFVEYFSEMSLKHQYAQTTALVLLFAALVVISYYDLLNFGILAPDIEPSVLNHPLPPCSSFFVLSHESCQDLLFSSKYLNWVRF